MLSILPGFLRGPIAASLFALNTLFWCPILLAVSILKWLLPIASLRRYLSKLLILIADIWIEGNSAILWLMHETHWDVQGVDGLDIQALHKCDSFLVVSNHRSWADIFVLQHVFKQKIPFLKFFLKQELIWVPLLGVCWWALDFPFLKRYSAAFLEKNPHLRGNDLATTRQTCEKFKDTPVAVMNFLEGTRFTDVKHEKQASPYAHLLNAKAGGVALVFSSMGDYLSAVLDVTIVYPNNEPPVNFWGLMKGDISNIVVRIELRPLPLDIANKSYEEDEVFRQSIKAWVNELWLDKDKLISTILSDKR